MNFKTRTLQKVLIYQSSVYSRGAGTFSLFSVDCLATRWTCRRMKIWWNFQALVWNTWGPIESGAQFAFGWTPATVAMFANWGTIMFLVSVVPLSKMMEVGECGGDSCITPAGQPSPHCSFCFWSHGIGDDPQMRKKVHQTSLLRKRQPDSFSHQVSNAPREESI